MKNKDGNVLASNAYVLLTSDYFPFSKTQCAVFKGTDRTVFLDKREYTGPIYKQIESAVEFDSKKYQTWSNNRWFGAQRKL